MRICIIGCGYVGKAIAQKWRAGGHEIAVTTRSLERAYELRSVADLVYILDEDWSELIKKQDVVLVSVAPDVKSDYIQTYLRTAENLLKALKGSSVSQIIYTGTTSIYGDHQGDWVTEDTAPNPEHANAHILLETERIFLKMTSDTRNVCIFRLGEIYGPGRSVENRLQRMQGQKFPGNGQNYTNLIRLDEILSALDLSLKNKWSGIFNLCNDIHLQRKEWYQKICELHGWPPVQWDETLKNPHTGNKRVSNLKLKSMGWSPLAKSLDG